MCWCFSFGFSGKKTSQSSSSGEKKRRHGPSEPLHGRGKTIDAQVSENPTETETHKKRRSGHSTNSRSPPRRGKEQHRPRSHHHYDDVYQMRRPYRPSLNVEVPDMWHRSVDPGSSEEALLNPRPHRATHQRQRHPKRTSQTTLRGRGAKRDPPRHSKSKKNLRPEPSRAWSLFAPSPPKTPKREHDSYQTLDPSSPRSHDRRRSSRQHERDVPGSRQARSRTPNTAARRIPDRRFAVLAATNEALETVRREAFAQPSPPPRRHRLMQYEGVTIPANQIPFSWDCVSSSQTSAGHGTRSGERSTRQRRSRH
ncbi:hypothetical protein ACEQ8H_007133 [Pleosporales sp. CAS-2024a]